MASCSYANVIVLMMVPTATNVLVYRHPHPQMNHHLRMEWILPVLQNRSIFQLKIHTIYKSQFISNLFTSSMYFNCIYNSLVPF